MKLLTKALLKKLPKLYSNENVPPEEQVAVLKIFDPTGRYMFYVTEGEERENDVLLYGYAISPLGPDCDEWGYASLNELQAVKGRLGLGLERDIYFSPTKISELIEK